MTTITTQVWRNAGGVIEAGLTYDDRTLLVTGIWSTRTARNATVRAKNREAGYDESEPTRESRTETDVSTRLWTMREDSEGALVPPVWFQMARV